MEPEKALKAKDTVSRKLALLANALFLVYVIVIACIYRKPELWCAIACDVIFFVALLGYRYWQARRPARAEAEKALSELREQSRLFACATKGWEAAICAVLAASCFYLVVDLAAFLFAVGSELRVANVIYRGIAPPAWTRLHPAFSMELLASACIEDKQFDRAEKLERSLLSIRELVAGERHELVAAMLANMGDFYQRAGKVNQAEACYRGAVQMSRELHLPQGYGSPLTKLGCLLRDQRRDVEADRAFADALAIRKAIFGWQSEKVAATLTEFAKLRQGQGRAAESSEMLTQARAIEARTSASKQWDGNASIVPTVVAAISILLFFGRDRFSVWTARRISSLCISGRPGSHLKFIK